MSNFSPISSKKNTLAETKGVQTGLKAAFLANLLNPADVNTKF